MKIAILVSVFILSISCTAQTGNEQPPYKRFPSFPPVKLMKTDSTYFDKSDLPKKSPVLLMLFNPQCEHCRHETEELTRNMDRFRKVSIIMATTMPFDSMKAFSRQFELHKFENITVTRDIQYFLPTFFMVRSLPFLAFYDKRKELISVYEGALPIPQIVAIFEK